MLDGVLAVLQCRQLELVISSMTLKQIPATLETNQPLARGWETGLVIASTYTKEIILPLFTEDYLITKCLAEQE
jgi:hypothetical protein